MTDPEREAYRALIRESFVSEAAMAERVLLLRQKIQMYLNGLISKERLAEVLEDYPHG